MSEVKEDIEMKVEKEDIEASKSEVSEKGEREGGGKSGFVDTPERNKNKIATPISKFEDSPLSSFLCNLSPIKPAKSAYFTQTFNSLNFASIPPVFASPHVSSIRESRFLRRHQLSDPSKPEFSSDNDVTVDTNEGILDVVNKSNESKKSFHPRIPVVEASTLPSYECSKLTNELARTLNYECSSPSTLPSGAIRSKCFVPFGQEVSENTLLRSQVNTDGTSQVNQSIEASGYDWESLISDAADLLIFDSPNDPEAFTKETDPNFRSYDFVSHAMHNMQNYIDSSECGVDGRETENASTQPEEGSQLKEYAETQNMIPDSFPTPDGMGTGQSEVTDNEMVSSLYRGMRRRCLVFEMGGVRRKHIDECSGSGPSPGSSAVQESDGTSASNEKQLVSPKTVNESSPCILPGIGLHLNALAAASKEAKVFKHEANASGNLLLIASGAAVDLCPVATGQGSLSISPPVTSTEIVPFENNVALMEGVSQASGYVNDELTQNSPKKKRRRTEPGEGESCKRCNCKKSKCLKLYCECFAAGVYCVEPCSCQDCFNKPIHEDTVLATRKQIESRNPLAFAPKVIRSTETLSEIGDDSSKTPASARHKRGCNCKKSGCLKKYCECYQGGVGCSINCRCEGCKNAFGRKDGSIFIGMDGDVEEGEADACEKSIVDRAHKHLAQNDVEQNSDSVLPATPLRFGRPPMQLPFSLKNKPPRTSVLSIGSSSGMRAGQGVGRPNFFQLQPKFDKSCEAVQEDAMPEILQRTKSPISGMKSGSPNSKRVSPPHCDIGISPGRRSSRKLILQSIPSFPSLTPNP